MLFYFPFRFALRTAECIVMVLGHVASHMGSKFNVVATVTSMFGQRLFHPASSLDGKLVGELARIAAHTGVRNFYPFLHFFYNLVEM